MGVLCRHNTFNVILRNDIMDYEEIVIRACFEDKLMDDDAFDARMEQVGKSPKDRLTILGEGSLEKGAEKFYNGFVGLRRFMGYSVRTRSEKSAGRYLMRKGLIKKPSEVGSFIRYLYVGYDPEYGMGDGTSVAISSWDSSRVGFHGYSVSRVIKENDRK